MIQLSREIRFALLPNDAAYENQASNSWGGWPTTNLIVPRLKLVAVIIGQPDDNTGYVCNVKVLDEELRSVVTNQLIPQFGGRVNIDAGQLLSQAYRQLTANWTLASPLVRLELHLSETFFMTVTSDQKDKSFVTQQFEFSAAHRLHCDDLSPEENHAVFGKCNNPSGHGHNYVFDVTVAVANGNGFDLEKLQKTVKSEILDRLDHKHLNIDVAHFADVNPSVENISMAIFGWLEDRLDQCQLHCVRVYETPKTWAEYFGK